MIPASLVAQANEVRSGFLDALERLKKAASFRLLLNSSSDLQSAFTEVQQVLRSPRLKNPFDAKVVCAFVGSSGHGKTTILAEMFPGLAQRGWLLTDVTDTTSQALRIHYAPARMEPTVAIHSWDLGQLRALASDPEVREQNARDNIRVSFREDVIEVDGTKATFSAQDAKHFKFPRKQELRPLPAPYPLTAQDQANPVFIRALTTKEPSEHLQTGPILSVNGSSYNSLQLRAIVKDVSLHDDFQQIVRWSGKTEQEVAQLVFVDTPGLAVKGSIKDEVLKNCLERKSVHIALQLWKADELDIIVHIVLCGRLSDFAELWKTVERECGPGTMEDLAERLILAINGTNLYFTNPDIVKRYADASFAAQGGDHFSTTLEDNILQRMSPRGRVQPARICFLDSKRILGDTNYRQFYDCYRPVLETWTQPYLIGHDSLNRLGLLSTFPDNAQALCDPEDRGQGYLIRQIIGLIEEKGPALFLRKNLKRTRLLTHIKKLRVLLLRYYDDKGSLNAEAVRESVRCCLQFLDLDNLQTIENFARENIDSRLDGLDFSALAEELPDSWVKKAFDGMCRALYQAVIQRALVPNEVAGVFRKHFSDLLVRLRAEWGYRSASLTPPSSDRPQSGDLLRHCLKVHAREILYQLLLIHSGPGGAAVSVQDGADQALMRTVLDLLQKAERTGERLCQQYGERVE